MMKGLAKVTIDQIQLLRNWVACVAEVALCCNLCSCCYSHGHLKQPPLFVISVSFPLTFHEHVRKHGLLA